MNYIKQIKYNRDVILFHTIFNNSCKIYGNNCIHSESHASIFTQNDDRLIIFSFNLWRMNRNNRFTLDFMISELIKRFNTNNYTIKIK